MNTFEKFAEIFTKEPKLKNSRLFTELFQRTKSWAGKILAICSKNKNHLFTDRPLSMLEVLYKIPPRILSKRLTETLPTIIGEHQHGFMKG